MSFSLPLYVFFFLYLLFMLVFLAFMFVNLYHLSNTASLTMLSFLFSFGIFAATILVLYATGALLIDVDWQQSVFQAGSSPGVFSDPF